MKRILYVCQTEAAANAKFKELVEEHEDLDASMKSETPLSKFVQSSAEEKAEVMERVMNKAIEMQQAAHGIGEKER